MVMPHAFFFFFFKLYLYVLSLLLFSESEPSVESACVTSATVRSDLRASVVLCADPDPHLLRLPDHYIPLGPTAALVHNLDTTYRVSTCCHYQCTAAEKKI